MQERREAFSARALTSNPLFQAERERDVTIEHLSDIDRLVNESLVMLSRYEDLVSVA